MLGSEYFLECKRNNKKCIFLKHVYTCSNYKKK